MVKLYLRIIGKIANVFIRLGFSPSAITIIGFFMAVFAGIAFWTGHLLTGGILLLVGGVFDNLDGAIARNSGNVTRFGALLDSTLDRYSEFVLFLGLYNYIGTSPDIVLYRTFQVIVFFALIGSVMVSYVRARSEALDIGTSVGFFQRPARVVMIGLAAMLAGLANHILDNINYFLLHDIVIRLLLIVLAIGTNITALRRLMDSRRRAKGLR
ncbi:MAG: CDP-alcohol phosphatidyltransferase family protein [Candidatus Zixiibacteriota bacterium]